MQESVGEQEEINICRVGSNGWTLGASFRDNNLSGSPFATKERENFQELIAAIQVRPH